MKQIEKRKVVHTMATRDDKGGEAGSGREFIYIPFVYKITSGDWISQIFFKQNEAYRAVVDSNKQSAFKIDAYSKEFLNFVPQLLEKVARSTGGGFERRQLRQSLDIGRKVGFEIMAKIPTNPWVGQISDQMINIIRD